MDRPDLHTKRRLARLCKQNFKELDPENETTSPPTYMQYAINY